MKIDRLIGITMYLLNRNIVSAKELAEKFEVSVRTIVRDMEALCCAGIPVSSSTGASGGYEIIDSFELNKQLIDDNDYVFVITALKGLCSAYNNSNFDTILEKILASNKHKDIDQRVFLDLSVASETQNINSDIKQIDTAIINQCIIEFDYTDNENNTRHRIVEPLALTYKWYSWYLFGYCTYKNDYRVFKLCRITELSVTDKKLFHEHTNVQELLKKQWTNDTRTYYDIKLMCKSEVKIPVIEYLKGTIDKVYENGDFLLLLHVPENERMWFSLLLGFGDKVTVIEPLQLRDRLIQKSVEIQNLYNSENCALVF